MKERLHEFIQLFKDDLVYNADANKWETYIKDGGVRPPTKPPVTP